MVADTNYLYVTSAGSVNLSNRRFSHCTVYLYAFLNNFIDYLTIGGRVAIISFHSLEDRQVKHRFKDLAREGRLTILTPKPLIASAEEIANNRRSKVQNFVWRKERPDVPEKKVKKIKGCNPKYHFFCSYPGCNYLSDYLFMGLYRN